MEGPRPKLLIFGTGYIYRKNREWILGKADVVAFIDNDVALRGTLVDGVKVYAPGEGLKLPHDKIVLMSEKYAGEMKQQLIGLGVAVEDILPARWLKSKLCGYEKTVYGTLNFGSGKKKILIITNDSAYHGGAVAVYNLAEVLVLKGYTVHVAAPKGDERFIVEMMERGISTMICPWLPYIDESKISFWDPYDVVIVNTFPMIRCAAEISKTKPVVWWLHECKDAYEQAVLEFSEYLQPKMVEKTEIYAVSGIARDNFNRYFTDRAKNLFAYGVEDKVKASNPQDSPVVVTKTVFSVIGVAMERKNQTLAINAYLALTGEEIEKSELWLIGMVEKKGYGKAVREKASQCGNIKICGVFSRAEMEVAYQNMDAVLCPSKEETMSIVVTEGMMHGKVCVVSDMCGMADYIRDGVNGFVVRADDVLALRDRMGYIIAKRGKLKEMEKRARETYEEHFTMESFAERADAVVKAAMDVSFSAQC